MDSKQSIITTFYTAFQKSEPKGMAACYHPNGIFEDPVFGQLNAKEVSSMWEMLIERGGKDLKIEFEIIREDESGGEAIWQAWYVFSKTKRPVHNVIHASFRFKDGKIIEHKDHFSFWKWSRMALGTSGLLLGWTGFLKKKVSIQSLLVLKKYMDSKNSN